MDVYVVLMHTDRGELGGVFSTMEAAMRYVGEEPGWSWSIIQQRLDTPPCETLRARVEQAWKASYLQEHRGDSRVSGAFPSPPVAR